MNRRGILTRTKLLVFALETATWRVVKEGSEKRKGRGNGEWSH